jgi:hypothetical protein
MQKSEQSSTRKLITGLIVFLWIGFLAGAYVWAHNPFNSPILTAVTQTVVSIIIWLSVCWLTTALGMLVISPLKLKFDDDLGELVTAAGIGLGFLAIILSFLGFTGLISRTAGWIIILLLLVITFRQWKPLFGRLKAAIRVPHPQNNFQWLIFVFVLVSIAYSFIFALTPTIAWDSLTYHLVGPKIYEEVGAFAHPLDIVQLGFPLLGQMLFMLGKLLVGDSVTALFHFGYGLLTLAFVIVLTRRIFSKEAAWFSALVLFSIPLLITLMSWPYVDVMLMFYTTAVFYAFYQWSQTKQTGWLVVVGMMIGFSGGLKYTAIAIPVAVTIGIIFISWRDGVITTLKRLLLVGSIALLLVLPWLIENYLTTGNPIYPFFFTEAKFWDSWRKWWYNRPGTGVLVTSPISLLLAPLETSVLDGTVAGDAYDGTIGPLILGMVFLLPFVWKKLSKQEKSAVGYLLLFVISAYLLWLWGIAHSALLLQTRLLLPAFGLLSLLAGITLYHIQTLKTSQLAVDWLVRILLSLLMIIILVSRTLTFLEVNPIPVLVGLESKEHFLERQLGTYAQVITAVNDLPPDSTVQFLWEARSYHCVVTCEPDPILDTWLHLTQYYEYSASDIAELWQEKGITHVLMHDAGLNFIVEAEFDPITSADLHEWEIFSEQYLQTVQSWPDQYTLYKFSP